MSDMPETVMNERCDGCAFRPGTEAANSPHTATLAKLCVLSGEPFQCHGPEGSGHLCRGFIDAFTVKLRNGDYDRLPKWKNELYRGLAESISQHVDAINRGESFDADAAMRDAIEGARLVAEAEGK